MVAPTSGIRSKKKTPDRQRRAEGHAEDRQHDVGEDPGDRGLEQHARHVAAHRLAMRGEGPLHALPALRWL